MKLRIVEYLWHRTEESFELRLTFLTNLLIAILALFSVFTGEILSNIPPSEDLPGTRFLTYTPIFWAFVFILAMLFSELSLHQNYHQWVRKISVFTYTFLIIPLGLYLTGSICITAMYCVLSFVLLNIIATPRERYIINPFLLLVIYINIILNYQFPQLLPPEPPVNVIYMHFLIDAPIVLILTVFLIAAMTENYRSEHSKLKKQNLKLEQIIQTDRLTGLFNKTYLSEQFPFLLDTAYQQKSPMAIFLVDIDYFKNYNTLYGNIKGDSCLLEVSNILKRNCFNITRHIYRFGGEEFLIVIPDTDINGARILAESITEDFHIKQIDNYRSMICNYITVSIGIYCYSGQKKTTTDEVIRRVDSALYTVKRKGRDGYYIETSQNLRNEDDPNPQADQKN